LCFLSSAIVSTFEHKKDVGRRNRDSQIKEGFSWQERNPRLDLPAPHANWSDPTGSA
jgi:hypothetical protein